MLSYVPREKHKLWIYKIYLPIVILNKWPIEEGNQHTKSIISEELTVLCWHGNQLYKSELFRNLRTG